MRYFIPLLLFLQIGVSILHAQDCMEGDTCIVSYLTPLERTYQQDSISERNYPQLLPLKADLMQITNEWKGTRYRYGGMSKQGTDCSGFVTRVLEQAMPQVQLPRTSRDMYAETMRIPLAEAQPGDLLFFRNGTRLPISHVAIYLGNGYFAHAVGYYGVIISHLSEEYHKKTFYAATRITEKNLKKTATMK
ncbi:MAG: C40 family peptidase [Bacteroidia bacterium]|nr:C40 family peptidase [Bacteroidia bacterium]MDW8347536.1 C40 family peptidase [Bacteroidia bacterium]